ncbi:MAG: acetylxylan esterase [Bacteroidaceae bacterium]|nr:acetylxylan esterase [Bacteroidaceae bacterium]
MKRFEILLLAIMMSVITMGQNKNAPVNYDENKVPSFEIADPLRCLDGQVVESTRQWESRRRPELLRMFGEMEYGVTPRKTGIKVRHEVVNSTPDAMDGLATCKQVRFTFTGKNGKSLQALLLLYIPNAPKGRVPVIVSYNFHGNQTTTIEPDVITSPSRELVKSLGSKAWVRGEQSSRWAYEMALQRGYAVATMCYHDICPDAPNLLVHGIPALLPDYNAENRGESEWGTIGIWAWGYSRIADYLEKEERVDKHRMAVLGHSRLGKTALWAGAQDKRFKVVISNNSGCGGAALSKRFFGENVSRITANFPHWFCPAFNHFSENESALPFDQHELLSLIAPRHAYVASAEADKWADPRGEYLSLYYAGPVYHLYGMQGLPSPVPPAVHQPQHYDVGYHIRSGGHDVTPYDWQCYLDFMDAALRLNE